MLTTNGASYKAFMKDEGYWGENTYYDDVLVRIDGVNSAELDLSPDALDKVISDTASVEIETGYIYEHDKKEDGYCLVKFFKDWQKTQTKVLTTVEVPKGRLAEFKSLMKEHGFKINH